MGPGLNARVRRTQPSLNLEISAQCWMFHSTAAKHLLVVQFRGALRTHRWVFHRQMWDNQQNHGIVKESLFVFNALMN